MTPEAPRPRQIGRGSRHGVVKNLTIPHHAAVLLEEYAANSRSYGMFIGELLVAEQARREEREKLRRDSSRGGR